MRDREEKNLSKKSSLLSAMVPMYLYEIYLFNFRTQGMVDDNPLNVCMRASLVLAPY